MPRGCSTFRAPPAALFNRRLHGPVANIGHGNGDPNSHEPEKGNRRSLFNGYAQIIIQSQRVGAGEIGLRAKSAGVKDAEVKISVKAVAPIPAVAKVQPVFNLQKWRVSPTFAAKPDANQEIADSDQNSWQPVQPGKLQTFDGGSYAIYRIKFKPFAGVQKSGGQIIFKSVTGKAEIWLDKKLIGRKDDAKVGPLTVPIASADGERTLSVLVEGVAGKPTGLGGTVHVETIAK